MEEFRFFLKSSFLRTCFQYVQFSYFLYKFIPNTYASDIPPFPIGILGEWLTAQSMAYALWEGMYYNLVPELIDLYPRASLNWLK